MAGGTSACVCTLGHVTSDSTPPSDSAKVKTRTAPRKAAISTSSARSKEIMPERPGYSTRVTRASASRKATTRRAFASCRSMRRERVFRPRSSRKQSKGLSVAPVVLSRYMRRPPRSGSAVTTAPAMTSLCPPRYLVAEYTTTSAPSSSGRQMTGV